MAKKNTPAVDKTVEKRPLPDYSPVNTKLWHINCQGITLAALNDDTEKFERLSQHEKCGGVGKNYRDEQALFAMEHTPVRLVQKGEYQLNMANNGNKGPKRCHACQAWFSSVGARSTSSTKSNGFVVLRRIAETIKQIDRTLAEVGDSLSEDEKSKLLAMYEEASAKKAEMLATNSSWEERLEKAGLL